jgi:hypothetical protein
LSISISVDDKRLQAEAKAKAKRKAKLLFGAHSNKLLLVVHVAQSRFCVCAHRRDLLTE